MSITRHYLTVNGRRVHYRKAGKGPPLLMVHQSPRSSAEYEPLMRQWSEHFTCIAPDTPGFGQSDPLADPKPEIDAFADAIVEFADAVGIEKIAGYGFHSGGIILVTAMKRHIEKFSVLAIGGYAIWNDDERKLLGDPYIPPNPPKPYGEHLVWLWNRVLEQSWYFPWFLPQDSTRLPGANDDPARVHEIILELLDAGEAYRLGYGAVLRGSRDIPPRGMASPPVLITAYAGDPLKPHLERLGEMPASWSAHGVGTAADHYTASLAHLLKHAPDAGSDFRQDESQGFLPINTGGFTGNIHWQGDRATGHMIIHAPGREAELVAGDAVRIDLPGHGLSSQWPGAAPTRWAPWQAVIDAVAAHFDITQVRHEPLAEGEPDRLFPDLSPDRFGNYLTAAWAIVRASHIFAPWYAASRDSIIAIDAEALAPDRLVREHRALIRATAARAMHRARMAG